MIRIASLVTVLLALPALASAQSIDGTWVTSESVRIRDTSGSVRDAVLTAHLELAHYGDSVSGTIRTAATTGFPASPERVIHGTLRDGRVLLFDEGTARVGGPASPDVSVRMVRTFDLVLAGDTLRGTESAASADGSFSVPSKPFIATRAPRPLGTGMSGGTADELAVRRAVADYVDALYQVRPELIERSVHPELAKRGFAVRDGGWVEMAMTYEQLHALAARWNASGRVDPATAVREIVVLDVLDQTASAKLVADWGIDYMHLARYDGEWKIVNVLWQAPPRQAPR